MAYTTADFLASVERQSFSPANQATFTASEILAIGDEVVKRYILPSILDVREEYLIDYTDYPILSGVSSYPIPPRSIGATVREIQVVDGSGNVMNLTRTSLDKLHLYASSSSAPSMFYLRGDKIVLFPTPSSTVNTLRVHFPLRPGSFVDITESAIISAIDTTTNVVTVTSIPSTWVTGNTFDLISRSGSQLYLEIDQLSSLVSGTAITLPSLPSDLAVGDYISISETSPLVQMPAEFRPVLATLTAAELLIAQNQPSGDKLITKGIKDLEIAKKLLTPRVWGEDEIILPDWS